MVTTSCTWKKGLAVACGILLSALGQPAIVQGQGCASYLGIAPEWLPNCNLRVNVQLQNFNNCGAPLPGKLQIRVYRDQASASGGVAHLAASSSCGYFPAGSTSMWRPVFVIPWPVGTTLYVEAWVDGCCSQADFPCSTWAPIQIVHTGAGDSDGDGVSDCADPCPLDPSPTCGAPPGSPSFVRGDLNSDLVLDLSDVTLTLNHLFAGGAVPDCTDTLDANDDGGWNIGDAVYLLGYLFLPGHPAPPQPFPTCGTDPNGSLGCAQTSCP